jgi:NitT/TauT family transport system substrate-binding protein
MRRLPSLVLALLVLFALACSPQAAPAPASAPARPAPASAAGSASSLAAPPATPVAMRFGLNTTGVQAATAWIAKDEGFFEKYGIDAELVVMQSSAQLAPALISGEIPITLSAATGIVNSALSGSDLVLLGAYANQLRFSFYARPEITSVRDLNGKQIAITRRGGAIHMATALALERNGLDPDRDATLIQVGSSPDILSAMLTGALAAGMFSPPLTFLAEDHGMRLLVDTGDYNYPMIFQGIASSRAWVARNEDLTRRTIQAIAEGLAFAHRQKERTKEIIAKYTKTEDPQVVEKTYNLGVARWERVPYAPPDALRSDLEMLAEEVPAARDARPEQFVDNRFIEELDRGGFFQRIYE